MHIPLLWYRNMVKYKDIPNVGDINTNHVLFRTNHNGRTFAASKMITSLNFVQKQRQKQNI